MFERSSGVLIHPTSLPGPFGIGDIGPGALRWIDWVAASGCRYWQMLPLGPTGHGDSPYQCFSAFAGNPYLISPEGLESDGLIDPVQPPAFPDDRVDFGMVIPWKTKLLDTTHVNFASGRAAHLRSDYEDFVERERNWLDDFALFSAIKRHRGGRPYWDWPLELRHREPAAIAAAGAAMENEIERERFHQFLFRRQWDALHRKAAACGVQLIGDAPIFVAHDSADLWSNPDLFEVDADLRPKVVAGVPPDYFTETGQLWGNPHYRWDRHAEDGYSWWAARLRSLLALVDVARIDHFRAFADYWEVPAGQPTADQGRWVLGPGKAFFQAMEGALGSLPLIAEDLGELHPIVPELRDSIGLPGMKIGVFSFEPEPDLPRDWPEWSVGYTGTHDNATTQEWLDALSPEESARVVEHLGVSATDSWSLISEVWRSPSVITITTAQDLLGLGAQARMNLPGTVGPHNWTWRMPPDSLGPDLADRLLALNQSARRHNAV